MKTMTKQLKVEQFLYEELARYYTGDKEVQFAYENIAPFDSFEIVEEPERYVIRAQTSRALLYGLYRFLEKVEGLVFFNLQEPQNIVREGIQGTYRGVPKFVRRGNVFETIDDVPFLKTMLDVGTKNGLNELFFTFFLWDEVQSALLEDIEKRGIDVTLGGHSLRYLIAKANGVAISGKAAADGAVNDLIGEETAFTAEHAINNDDFLQNEELQQKVIALIVSYCQQYEVVRRISLWPEDVGAKGEEAVQFLTRYITFTEKLQQAIEQAGLSVAVENIVYNAGLSWEMLERNEQKVGTPDILYAYWGRDYRAGYENERDARAWNSLTDWRSNSTKQITVFEYYSDHFMLSELFPLLFQRILKDVEMYKQAGCDGLVNLVVPLHKVAKAQSHMDSYDYQAYQQLNNIVYARALWEGLETLPHLLSPAMQQLALQLETLLAENSRFNSQFFPSRVVEAKNAEAKQDVLQMLTAIEQLLHEAQPETVFEQYVQALQQVVTVTKQRWEAL